MMMIIIIIIMNNNNTILMIIIVVIIENRTANFIVNSLKIYIVEDNVTCSACNALHLFITSYSRTPFLLCSKCSKEIFRSS